MDKLSTEQRAYLAGLFDGEGCITISKYCPRGKSWHYQPLISLAMTDSVLMEYVALAIGTTLYTTVPNDGRRTIYTARLYNRKAQEFLQSIFPWLRAKRAQAEIIERFMVGYFGQRKRNRWNAPHTEESRAVAEACWVAIRRLQIKPGCRRGVSS